MKAVHIFQKHLLTVALIVLCLLSLAADPAYPKDTGKADPPQSETDDNRKVAIDFNGVDIHVFIKFFSELTGKNFVVDQKVKGTVTIISPSKITVAEAFKVFESVLEVHGYATVEAGEVVKVIPLPEARTRNIDTLIKENNDAAEDKVVTQLIPLTYADADDLQKLLTPLVSKSSIILSYQPTNLLMITDVYSNIKRLLDIIGMIDVAGVGKEILVLSLDHADADKMVKTLKAIFEGEAKKKGSESAGYLKFVSDERTNSIIVIGSKEQSRRVRDLVSLLDQQMPRSKEKVHVRYLEYANAENLVTVLRELQSKGNPADKESTANHTDSQLQITADPATNSLIIRGDKDDYLALNEIIDKLDIRRPMVYIESLIMEVDVSKDFQIGTEWQTVGKVTIDGKEGAVGGAFSGKDRNEAFNTLSNLAAFGESGAFPAGASIGVFTEEIEIAGVKFPNLSAIIEVFKEDKGVNIISTPQLLTTDNEEAKIFVGKNVPFQTKTSTSDNDTFNSFEYRDVGTTLEIKPQISQGQMVRLNISHVISTLESSVDFRPTTLNRSIDTTVLVSNNSTVVIGGLIDTLVSRTEWKVPFLGDIPILGWLFKSEGKSTEKTNLFVFLTPRVVQNQEEAENIYNKKNDEINKLRENSIELYPKSHNNQEESLGQSKKVDKETLSAFQGNSDK